LTRRVSGRFAAEVSAHLGSERSSRLDDLVVERLRLRKLRPGTQALFAPSEIDLTRQLGSARTREFTQAMKRFTAGSVPKASSLVMNSRSSSSSGRAEDRSNCPFSNPSYSLRRLRFWSRE